MSVCVVQAIAQLAPMFPSLPASAIADALDKAGGNLQHVVDALLQAAQVNARLDLTYEYRFVW
jgi:hypothetical protein